MILRYIIEFTARMIVGGVSLEFLFNNYGIVWLFCSTPILMFWILIPIKDLIFEVIDNMEEKKITSLTKNKSGESQ